ncbi:hypothetical protein AAMO2058_001668700 [Amorphochlora amoebiformis]
MGVDDHGIHKRLRDCHFKVLMLMGRSRCTFISILVFCLILWTCVVPIGKEITPQMNNSGKAIPKVLIHYTLAERDNPSSTAFTLENLKLFLQHGVKHSPNLDLTYRVTINGNISRALRMLEDYNSCAWHSNPKVHILQRENSGYDFGAHYAMLKSEARRLGVNGPMGLPYDACIFLNDGVRGPFVPTYMPKGWHWAQGFLSRLSGPVQLVGTSLACLADDDEAVVKFGMVGPKVETFAFAITGKALRFDIQNGTSFANKHETKYDAIIRGEYNLSYNILNSPYHWSITSMLLQHRDLDFRDRKNWKCNEQLHPSRQGTYAGISISPFEVIFHKSWWRTLNADPDVSAREMQAYTKFMTQDAKSWLTCL